MPEFVPMSSSSSASKAVDSARDDDEDGTDGDDEAEIVDNQILIGNNKKPKADFDNWVEVKSRKQDRKSLPKESGSEGKSKNDGREELEFQFDEDLDMPVGRQNKFSSMNDSTDDDELSDGEISKLLIVTQTPLRPKKHEGFDRTGDFCSRVKMSQDLAQVINDGLCFYEDHQFDNEDEHETWIESKRNVNLISQAEFEKLKNNESSSSKKVVNNYPPPPPPPLNTPAVRLLEEQMATPSKLKNKQSHFYPVTKEPTTPSQDVPRKRKTRHSQNPVVEMHVGWILDSRSSDNNTSRARHDSFSDSQSLSSSYGTPQSLPTFHHPSHALLKENGFTQLQYSKYHSRCLKGNLYIHIFVWTFLMSILCQQNEKGSVQDIPRK